MKKNILPTLIAASALALGSSASAAVIANYNFTTNSNNTAGAVTGITTVTAFGGAGNFGAGHTGNAGSIGYVIPFPTTDTNAARSASAENYFFRNSSSDGTTLAQAISGGNTAAFSGGGAVTGAPVNNGNDYSSFSITVDTGYVLNLSSLTFTTTAVATSPLNFSLLTNVGGFTAGASVNDLTFGGGATSASGITGSAFDSLGAGTYEFRFYTYGARWGAGPALPNDPSRIDNVILNGDLTVIPEPSAALLLIGSIGIAAMFRRRRA